VTPTIRFVIITAIRDRLFISLFALLALAIAVSAYFGSGAVAESREMTVVYAAGGARVMLVLGLTLFAAFHIERLFESREIEALLSRAISREAFVVAYWLAMAGVSLLVLIPTIAAIFAYTVSYQGAAYWAVTVLMESLVVIAFAMFCGMTFERAIPTIFATAGFYLLARLVGFFTSIAEHGVGTGINSLANPLMEYLSYLLPRLDLAGQTEWLIYGTDGANALLLIVLQGSVYVVLLLSATMFDLRRKHF